MVFQAISQSFKSMFEASPKPSRLPTTPKQSAPLVPVTSVPPAPSPLRDMPHELLSNIHQFLGFESLIKNRLVCRRWHTLLPKKVFFTSISIANKKISTLKGFNEFGGKSALIKLDLSFTRITNDSLIVLGQFTSLQSLNLSACPNISSLEGIQRLSQLKWLSLRACRALRTADFTPIQHLPLVYADLSTTMISDSALACFKGMTTLAYLNIALTFITNISCLEGIPLTYLNISRTSVADISCVEDMPLTGFNAESSNVSILKPLEKTPLRYLNIVLCIGITDFSFIKKLKQLTQLKVSETSITDKDLANWCLPALKKLDLEGCRKISQKGLELLRESDLPSLTQLDLSGCNKIPKEEVREIFAGTRIKVTQKFIPLREE